MQNVIVKLNESFDRTGNDCCVRQLKKVIYCLNISAVQTLERLKTSSVNKTSHALVNFKFKKMKTVNLN